MRSLLPRGVGRRNNGVSVFLSAGGVRVSNIHVPVALLRQVHIPGLGERHWNTDRPVDPRPDAVLSHPTPLERPGKFVTGPIMAALKSPRISIVTRAGHVNSMERLRVIARYQIMGVYGRREQTENCIQISAGIMPDQLEIVMQTALNFRDGFSAETSSPCCLEFTVIPTVMDFFFSRPPLRGVPSMTLRLYRNALLFGGKQFFGWHASVTRHWYFQCIRLVETGFAWRGVERGGKGTNVSEILVVSRKTVLQLVGKSLTGAL